MILKTLKILVLQSFYAPLVLFWALEYDSNVCLLILYSLHSKCLDIDFI